MPVFNRDRAIAQERITVDATVGGVGLTMSKWIAPPLARTATLTVETASCRYLTDGTAPTATTGTLVYAGDVIELRNPSEIQYFRAIRTGATSATIQVVYHGAG